MPRNPQAIAGPPEAPIIDLYANDPLPTPDDFVEQSVRLATAWSEPLPAIMARVYNGLAVHSAGWRVRDHFERREAFALTHVATGHLVCNVPDEETAFRLACRLSRSDEWVAIAHLTRDKLKDAHGRRLARRIKAVLADYPPRQRGFPSCCLCRPETASPDDDPD